MNEQLAEITLAETDDHLSFITSAERTLEAEVAGLSALRAALHNGLAKPFCDAVSLIARSPGRVIISGIGKSGHIGTKLAATLASTGTPAFFVHAAEASHGDLGMITSDDVVIALSWSGETQELASLVSYTRRFKVPMVAVTSAAESTLGSASDIVLAMPKVTEACPHGLAPTTSTLVQMAVGDALAIALLEARGFTAQDFRIFHPGGRLGASLKTARDIMHTGNDLPIIAEDRVMSEALILMTQKGFGTLGIVNDFGKLTGVITDGDLRRHLSTNLLEMSVCDVMTPNPKTIDPSVLSGSIMELLNSKAITSVFVVEGGRPVGLIHLHDLLRIGIA